MTFYTTIRTHFGSSDCGSSFRYRKLSAAVKMGVEATSSEFRATELLKTSSKIDDMGASTEDEGSDEVWAPRDGAPEDGDENSDEDLCMQRLQSSPSGLDRSSSPLFEFGIRCLSVSLNACAAWA